MKDNNKSPGKHATDARWRKALKQHARTVGSASFMHASAGGTFVCDLPDVALRQRIVDAHGHDCDAMGPGCRLLLEADELDPCAPSEVADWLWEQCLGQALAYAEEHDLSVVRLGLDLMDEDGEMLQQVARCRRPVDPGPTENDGEEEDPGTVTVMALLRRADGREKGLHSMVMDSHKREANTLKTANKTIENATTFQTSMIEGMSVFLSQIAEDASGKLEQLGDIDSGSSMDPETQQQLIAVLGSWLQGQSSKPEPEPPKGSTVNDNEKTTTEGPFSTAESAWPKERRERLTDAIHELSKTLDDDDDDALRHCVPELHAWLGRLRQSAECIGETEAGALAGLVEKRAPQMRDNLKLPLLLKLKKLADAVNVNKNATV